MHSWNITTTGVRRNRRNFAVTCDEFWQFEIVYSVKMRFVFLVHYFKCFFILFEKPSPLEDYSPVDFQFLPI